VDLSRYVNAIYYLALSIIITITFMTFIVGLSSMLQGLCVRRSISDGATNPFFYMKYKADWIYMQTKKYTSSPDPNITGITLCLVSRTFDPDKHAAILSILIQQHEVSGDPTKILEGFLSIVTTGTFSNSQGSFNAAVFTPEKSTVKAVKLNELVSVFGADTAALWNAVLLKKRILVYADSVPKLQGLVSSLPALAWHRKDWSVLRPLVYAEQESLEDLQSAGVFIAGTTDAALVSRTDLFDVIASVPEKRVSVVDTATDDGRGTVFYREISNIFVPSDGSAPSRTDVALLQAVAERTGFLVERLQGMRRATREATEAEISSMSKVETTTRWLIRVAAAEGIL
jgi:hypothetical protein